jgi:hypothetical protein
MSKSKAETMESPQVTAPEVALEDDSSCLDISLGLATALYDAAKNRCRNCFLLLPLDISWIVNVGKV